MWLVLFLFKETFLILFWIFLIQYAVHLIKRIPSPLLKNNSLFQLLYNKAPPLLHLKTFGCLYFSSTLISQMTKFDICAKKTHFLGFRNGTKGYFLYDLHSHNFLVFKNTIFYETVFPFHLNHNPTNTSHQPNPYLSELDFEPVTPNQPPYLIPYPLFPLTPSSLNLIMILPPITQIFQLKPSFMLKTS